MAIKLELRDESTLGDSRPAPPIELPEAQTTVRDLIAARVCDEVARHNRKPAEIFEGLVQPEDSERVLNGFRLRARKSIDPDQQCLSALNGFKNRAFVVLIDDRQAESLDEEVLLKPGSTATFLRLVPLIGG